MKIHYTAQFTRHFRKLPDILKDLAEEKEGIFEKDPFNPSLKTHKLHGKFSGCYAFSINYKHRIIFEFTNEKTIIFMLIGSHKIYE